MYIAGSNNNVICFLNYYFFSFQFKAKLLFSLKPLFPTFKVNFMLPFYHEIQAYPLVLSLINELMIYTDR